jgi:hypothetical protein
MKPENKSEKRKAESENFSRRTTGGAPASFLFAGFSHCGQRPASGFSFRFPLSAFRFCL